MEDPRVAFSLFGIAVHWYGIIIAAGLITGVILGVREAKRRGYRSDLVLDFMLIAIPVCIVCARLYYVIPMWQEYSYDLLRVFAVWEGGLAIYGAVIGGVIAAFIFYKWRKVPIGDMMDIAAPSLIIGQAIGRWGNFVNQEAFGNAVTNPGLQWFPYSVYIDRLGGWYQATFFYESVWNFIAFAVLMIMRKRIKVRGGVFALYLAFYGFGRFFIEQLRSDSLMAGSARISQWLSLVLVVIGIVYLIIMSKRKKEYPAYDGLYSLAWSDEQVEEYKKRKKIKDKEQPEAETQAAEEKKEEAKPRARKNAKGSKEEDSKE